MSPEDRVSGGDLDVVGVGVCGVTIRRLLYAKEMTLKGWLDFNSLDLTNGVARTDSEDNVSGARASGSKGESVTTTAEAGAEDTSSDGY